MKRRGIYILWSWIEVEIKNKFGYWWMEKKNRMADTEKHRENGRHREAQGEW